MSRAIQFDGPIEDLVASLDSFPWDSAAKLAILARQHVTSVLDRFTVGELSSAEVTRWAFLLHDRDDVELEKGSEEVLGEVMFWLAMPQMNFSKGVLDTKSAKELRERLNAAPA